MRKRVLTTHELNRALLARQLLLQRSALVSSVLGRMQLRRFRDAESRELVDVLPEEYRPEVFTTRTSQSVPTFLVDGAVAGTSRYDAGRVVVEPFTPLPRDVRREVDDEAKRLSDFHR